MSREKSNYTWDRERPKGDSSEWPTTSHSTLISEYEARHSKKGRRVRHRSRSSFRKLLLPFVFLLVLAGIAVQGLSRLLHG